MYTNYYVVVVIFCQVSNLILCLHKNQSITFYCAVVLEHFLFHFLQSTLEGKLLVSG